MPTRRLRRSFLQAARSGDASATVTNCASLEMPAWDTGPAIRFYASASSASLPPRGRDGSDEPCRAGEEPAAPEHMTTTAPRHVGRSARAVRRAEHGVRARHTGPLEYVTLSRSPNRV